jgi:phytoene desaturase
MSRRRVVIIGAGYGGLALANLLAKSGYAVEVYEKNESTGGRIYRIERDGFHFEIGPSWYLMPEIFEQYYRLFDRDARVELDIQRLVPGYKVFFDAHPPIVIEGDVEKDALTFDAIAPGAGDALQRYVATSTRAYRVATKYFLYSNFQSLTAFFKWEIIRDSPSLLRLVWRTLDQYVSRSFNDQRLAQMLEYHMVFLGSSPFQAPALYTLMSHLDFRSGVFYPRNGMQELVTSMQRIGEELGVSYYVNSPVSEIVVTDGVASGVKLSDGRVVAADIVVSNADMHYTETQLLAPQYQTYPESYWKHRQPGPGALLIALGVKGSLPTLMHHSLYFVDEWRENFQSIYETGDIPEHASMYICNPTKTDPSLAPSGHEVMFVLMPIPAGVLLNEAQTDRLVKRVIDTCAVKLEIPDLESRITTRVVFGPRQFGERYHAWQYNAFSGESHILRQSVIFRTGNKSRKVQGLYYVGAGALPGIGLPMCLIGAQQTYKLIRGIRNDGPLTHIEELST